jgi:hypothetical protein
MKRATIKLICMALLLATVTLWLPNMRARAAAPCTFTGVSAFCQDNVKTSIICTEGLEPITIQAPCNLGGACRAVAGVLFCCYDILGVEVCLE